MSKEYKEEVLHHHVSEGTERRLNLVRETLLNGTPLPQPVTYKDIDTEFKHWVDTELSISFNGTEASTMVLYSNQRFTEYLQNWNNSDVNRNMHLNTKLITRENNPKQGKINGDNMNIPGNQYYTISRVLTKDDNGKDFYLTYKMKQPYAVDFRYKLTFLTNKFENLNEFNSMILSKFKSLQCYVRPCGHFMSLTLDEVADNSEYNISDRQFYSQTYTIVLKGYIINEDDLVVSEDPILVFKGVAEDIGTNGKCEAEIEEYELDEKMNYPVKVSITLEPGSTKYKFTSDCDMMITGMTCSNLNSVVMSINDDMINYTNINGTLYNEVVYDSYGNIVLTDCKFDKVPIYNGYTVKIKRFVSPKASEKAYITMNGYKILVKE